MKIPSKAVHVLADKVIHMRDWTANEAQAQDVVAWMIQAFIETGIVFLPTFYPNGDGFYLEGKVDPSIMGIANGTAVSGRDE